MQWIQLLGGVLILAGVYAALAFGIWALINALRGRSLRRQSISFGLGGLAIAIGYVLRDSWDYMLGAILFSPLILGLPLLFFIGLAWLLVALLRQKSARRPLGVVLLSVAAMLTILSIAGIVAAW